MPDVMDIRRGDGWPQRLGSGLVLFGVGIGVAAALLDSGTGAVTRNARLGVGFGSLLLAAMGFMLQAWRRVTTLDRKRGRIHRWWGLAFGPWLLPVNGLEERSLEGYDRLVLAPTSPEEHYKRQRNRFQLQLERSQDTGPLRPRLRVDDELVSAAAGRELGRKVADFLGLELHEP